MKQCNDCNKKKCTNGRECKWKHSDTCWFCHCSDKNPISCHCYDDCTETVVNNCEICKEPVCESHASECEICSKNSCIYCAQNCENCGDWFCNSHMVHVPNFEIQDLCTECYTSMIDIVHGDYSDADGHDHGEDFYFGY